VSGITPEGFERPSFAEIRAALVERAREIVGPINTGPESAIGQQITIQAEREALLWEALEAVYFSQYPRSASGLSLDGAVELTGITRLGATRTVVQVDLTGEPGTLIPLNSEASTNNGGIFRLVTDVTLDGLGEGSGQMIAVETGPVLALAGTLTNIETPVSGWDGVTNPLDGEVGRPIESDPELRLRRAQSLAVTGAGTVPSIRSRLLQQVPDVTAVSIIENRSDVVDADGRPPHSFEAVVSGGIDQDVADLIWLVKPAGIETTGEILVDVTDSQGEIQPIRFSRPIQIFIWVRLTLTPGEAGSFQGGAEEAAKDAIVEFGETLGVGNDVIYQALFGPVFAAVPGIGSLVVELASSPDPEMEPGEFAVANISIGKNEIALFLADRIEVTINA
jgi:uncharacterized phage protein gp47/JayE